MRVAQGFDAHPFSADPARALWLGLIHLPEGPGLEGHSDADVATHALCDALLGGANLGDLGQHFPDDDPAHHGESSRVFLDATMKLISSKGLGVLSADVTILAERPRLAPFVAAMSDALSVVVGTLVSVKATSTNGLGSLGRGEGVAANAVVLLDARS